MRSCFTPPFQTVATAVNRHTRPMVSGIILGAPGRNPAAVKATVLKVKRNEQRSSESGRARVSDA